MKYCLYLLLGICFAACGGTGSPEKKSPAEIERDNIAMIQEAAAFVQNGDIIVRTGRDFTSDRIREMAHSDNTYSHAGVAFIDSTGIHIYNIVPKEKNNLQEMRVESLDTFCNPVHNKGFGIARFALSPAEVDSFRNFFIAQYKKNTTFDFYFDLGNDTAMYCSEMIKKGLERTTHNRINIVPDTVRNVLKIAALSKFFKLPKERFVNLPVIPVDKIYANDSCKMVKQYVFN
jgi:hypothetical protein